MALISASKRKPLLVFIGLVVVISIICGIIFRKRAYKPGKSCVLPMQSRLAPSSPYISYEPLALLIRKRITSQYHNKVQGKLNDDRYVCTTKECVYIANQIISLMNTGANPCEDFYSFACGGLETALGKDTNYSVYRQQDMHFHRIIRDIVEKAKGPPGSAMQKLKIVYESCMNEESSELNSLQSIQQFLDEIGIPNWPYLNSNFKFENPPLDEVLGRLYSYGQHSFFTFLDSSLWIDFDSDNGTVFRNLTISSQYNFFDRRVETEAVKKVVTEILSKWDLSSSAIKYIVEKFAEVDNNILHLNKINKRTHNCATLNDAIHCQYTYCSNTSSNKETLICKVLKSSVRNARQESIYPTEGYCSRCYNTFYSENIESVMNNYSDWHLAHYIALRVLIGNCEYLKFSFRKKYKEIFKITQFDGRSSKAFELDKWKLCTNFLINSMQNPLGVLYASEILSGDIMKDVNDIFDEYQNELVNIISQQNWIDDITKETITKKLRNLTNELNNFVGPYFNEIGEINAVYQKFQFNPTKESFIRNVLENYKFYVTASSYNPAILKYLGSYNPISMKLFYAESIVLGLGFLLPPVYKHEFERIFNYAKLGQILTHEFGHVFYDTMMENQDHVDNKTQNNYEEKLRCLRNQFSNFTIGRIGKHIKGVKTLSENFADNIAIKITEKIAQKYLQDMMQKKFSLPGLPYSAEELFYISYSQLWCSVSDIDKEKYSYKVEEHSPPSFRVIGMLQNSDRFSEVFKCPPRAPMNPLQKCSILDL